MSDEEPRVPLGTVLGGGFLVSPLPTGWTPLEGVVLVKCLDEEGHSSLAFRATDGLNDEELLGALLVRYELAKQETLAAYADGEDD